MQANHSFYLIDRINYLLDPRRDYLKIINTKIVETIKKIILIFAYTQILYHHRFSKLPFQRTAKLFQLLFNRT